MLQAIPPSRKECFAEIQHPDPTILEKYQNI
jgi:hypothetical protein